MNNDKFEIDTNGAPTIIVSGTTKVIDIDSNGAGKIDTHNLHAARAWSIAKASRKVDLDVADQLDVTVSGPSTVTYKGDPVVNKTIHGPGKVETPQQRRRLRLYSGAQQLHRFLITARMHGADLVHSCAFFAALFG